MPEKKIEDIKLPSPLTKADLHQIILGACFFASGGGGPLEMALSFLDEMKAEVSCIDTDDLDPEKVGFVVCDMGSPEEALEHHLGYTAPVNAFNALKGYLEKEKKPTSYLLPIEMGAVNTLLPFYIASKVKEETCEDIKVINGDPSGRAVPTIGLTLLHTKGTPIPICPAAVASDSGPIEDKKIFADPNIDPDILQSSAGRLVEGWGKVGGLACYPAHGKDLKTAPHGTENQEKLIQGSIGLAWKIGEMIIQSKSIELICQYLEDFCIQSYILIENAKLKAVEPDAIQDIGKFTLKNDDFELWVYYENENLLAYLPSQDPRLMGVLRAMAPDTITFITAREIQWGGRTIPKGTPLSTADVVPDEYYTIVGLAASAKVRNEPMILKFQTTINEILDQLHPGMNIGSYITIEKLHKKLIS